MLKPIGSTKPMRRSSGNRQAIKKLAASYKLMVHGPEYGSGEELVINPDTFPDLKLHDIVEIAQPERLHLRLIMQVRSLSPVRGKLQISILKDLAVQFQLEAFHEVTVTKIEPEDATVDFIELSFKDQYMSRADIWRYKVAMFGKCLFVGKVYETLGTRAQVEMLLANDQNVQCGVMGKDTKLILRSRSSRIFWLIQMSTEMWDFADDGEMYFEKLVHRLVRVLVAKWQEASVSHSVTLIMFSRSFYDKSQFPDSYDPTTRPFANECTKQAFGPGIAPDLEMAYGHGPAMQVDAQGRYYEDFYKVLIQDYTGPDWSELFRLLRGEFASYAQTHRWRLSDDPRPARYSVSPSGVVQWHELPAGVPSRASEGNVLEAINVTLNILDKHYMDRDLNRAGQGIVMISGGAAVFRVPKRLVQITKQRMIDNGVGMDMISLSTPPIHPVPLFIWKQAPYNIEKYSIPHWISVSFLDFDCTCGAAKKSLMRCHCQPNTDVFHPLPICRMFDRFIIPAPLVQVLSPSPTTISPNPIPEMQLQRTIDHSIIVDSMKECFHDYDEQVFAMPTSESSFLPIKLTSNKFSFTEVNEVKTMLHKRVTSMQNLQRYKQYPPPIKQGSAPLCPIGQKTSITFSPNFSPPEDTPVHHLSSFDTSCVSSMDFSLGGPVLTKNRSTQEIPSPRSRNTSMDTNESPPPPSMHIPSTSNFYRTRACNPFLVRNDQSESKLTSNRRRWSHIFPWTQENASIAGPNWKSLVNPAVLPLTTDFFPKDLHQSYTESFYSLMVLETKDRNTQQLLIEIVCQRLSSDFQLVDFAEKVSEEDGSGRLSPAQRQRTMYLLSMGHRIHKLLYDEAQQTIDVKCYHKRLKNTNHDPVVYEYSLYDPTTCTFLKQLQTFHELPQPEHNWNTTDNMLCGYVDSMHDGTKCRRIRFVVVPSKCTQDPQAHIAKLQKLLDFLQSKVAPDETLNVKLNTAPIARQTCTPTKIRRQYIRIGCNTPARMEVDCRNEWLMLLVDEECYPNLNFHMDVRWLACSGTVVDDFVTTLRRKSKQAGVELRRVPEYTQVHHLHIHPCLSSILLPVRLPPPEEMNAILDEWDFVFDCARLADTNGIGHGLMPSTEATTPGTSRHNPVCPEVWKSRGYEQYMHRTAPVFLRVLHNRFVWIPSYGNESNTIDNLQVQPLFERICQWIGLQNTP